MKHEGSAAYNNSEAGHSALQAWKNCMENGAFQWSIESICIYIYIIYIIDGTFFCFLENTLHIIMCPRHPNTSKKEGIWTLKPYPRHQTSGDVWMSRGKYIYIHTYIFKCTFFLGLLCFFLWTPSTRFVQLEDSPHQNAGFLRPWKN